MRSLGRYAPRSGPGRALDPEHGFDPARTRQLAGMTPVLIDRTVAIAHNKLVLIDRGTVIIGSLNWTKAGNTKNAENVHVLRGAPDLAEVYASYFRERESVSEPYRAASAGPTNRQR